MDQEYFEMNIESWATSLMELEESQQESLRAEKSSNEGSALVSLAAPTYYRSKAFASAIGINSLINAADPLFTLVTKLRRITIPPDPLVLHQNLCHELKAFENKAQTQGYRPQLILASQYVICALIDELITTTLWPNMEWKKFSLIETFHKELLDQDRFFLILDRSLQDVTGHIDLLELIYLCLRLGYEGKYRGIDRGHLELRSLTDNLYNVIKANREDYSRSLHISLENPHYHLLRKRNYFYLMPPTWVVSTIMIVSLITFFTVLCMRLVETTTPLTQFLNESATIAQT